MRHKNTILNNLVPASAAPSTPNVGDIWVDSRTGETLVWGGTYWHSGDLVRVEDVLAVGVGPVASVDLGWNVPAGYAVVKASLRLLKALTGAGGCTIVGLGIGAAEGKYGDTASLLIDQTFQTINPTWNDGAAEDIKVYAESAHNTPAGTIAGSASGDIRVMTWMRPIVVLAA